MRPAPTNKVFLSFIPHLLAVSNAQIADNCLAKSLALKNLTITNGNLTRGNGLQAQASYISFDLGNPAINVSGNCSASGIALVSNAAGGDPFRWYDCPVDKPAPDTTTLAFRYDSVINHLTINQTWTCGDPESGQLVQLAAFGFEWFDLSCAEQAFANRCQQEEGDSVYFPVEVTARRL